MNSRRGARRSGRRARYLGGASLVAACAAFLAIPGGASAIAPDCSGKLTLDKHGDAGQYGVDYTFGCKVPKIENDKADIQAFGLVASRRLDYFRADPDVIQPDGEVSSTDAFNCEGPVPGPGFGCPGTMTAGNHVSGQFATIGSPCRHQERRGAGNVVVPAVQAWVTVTFQDHKNDLDPNTPPTYYTSQSAPYNLGKPKGCPTNKRARAHHRRHHRAHHRAHRH